MKKLWIAFSGKAGCGKTTIAKNLVQKHGFTRLSFATRLKEISNELFPKIMSKKKEEFRPTLQLFGCFCRLIETTCWINPILLQLERIGHKRIVIDDVRFLNEFDGLRYLGFKLIRVSRSKALRRTWGYNVNDPHPSERELDHVTTWDLKLGNNGKYPFLNATRRLEIFLGLTEVKT